MKTFKNGILVLLVLFTTTCLITSCSNDDETNQNVSKNAKVDKYLKSFYATNYQLGKAVETKQKNNSLSTALNRTIEAGDIVITEVFVGNDSRARGYIITLKETDDFLYFIDVDRVDFKMTTVKIDVNDTKVFDNIDELDKYVSTDQLDFIKIAEEYNANPEFAERRFWGWTKDTDLNWSDCTPDGVQYATAVYHVFWVETAITAEVRSRPCNYNPFTN